MSTLFSYANLLWYGGLGILSLVSIYVIIWFGRLVEITRIQLVKALSVGALLSVILIVNEYFRLGSEPVLIRGPLYSIVFDSYLLIFSGLGIVCAPYFFIAGRKNLLEKYGFDFRYKRISEIRKLKESN